MSDVRRDLLKITPACNRHPCGYSKRNIYYSPTFLTETFSPHPTTALDRPYPTLTFFKLTLAISSPWSTTSWLYVKVWQGFIFFRFLLALFLLNGYLLTCVTFRICFPFRIQNLPVINSNRQMQIKCCYHDWFFVETKIPTLLLGPTGSM